MAIPATPPRPAPAWRTRAERLWRWWSGELIAMAPALAGATRVPLLRSDGDALVLLEPRPAQGADRVDLAGLQPTQAVLAVRSLLDRAGETRGRARLALAPGEALLRRVSMPAATEENLSSVLGFEMDRLTPFRAEDVYFDHRVLARDSAAGTLSVLLAVARRDLVDRHVDRMRELGVSVQGVEVREEPARGGPALDVLPSGQRGERERPGERRLRQALAGAALVLLVAALAIPVLRKRAEVHAIKPLLDRAHAEAKSTDALIRNLERQVAEYNFLLEKKHALGPTMAYIEEVSRLLPDNTWVQQFDVKTAGKAREVQVSGETVSSSKLIEILEQSRLLQNAAPRGTITRGSTPGTERFVIAAEARPRAAPEARPVTEAQVAPPAPPMAPPTHFAEPAQPPAPAAARPASASPAPPHPGSAAAAPAQQDIIFKPIGKTMQDPALAPKGKP